MLLPSPRYLSQQLPVIIYTTLTPAWNLRPHLEILNSYDLPKESFGDKNLDY